MTVITASEIVCRMPMITGIPETKSYQAKRRFVETGLWPSSRGATVPKIDLRNVVQLLLALLVDVQAKDASKIADEYYNLTCDVMPNLLFGDFIVDNINDASFEAKIEVNCLHPYAVANIKTIGTADTMQWAFGKLPNKIPYVERTATISSARISQLRNGLLNNIWNDFK